MYERCRLYVWRGQVGYMAIYNGAVCHVTGPRVRARCATTGRTTWGWPTDSPSHRDGATVYAEAGDLQPIDPPSGEWRIYQLFKDAQYLAALHMDQVDVGGYRIPIERPIRP